MLDVITITQIEPEIGYGFNKFLLMTDLERIVYEIENKIIPRGKRKIRPLDTGRRKAFQNLIQQYQEMYERKKAEKEEYDEKIKNTPKRFHIPITGGSMRFRRYRDQAEIARTIHGD